MYKRQHLSFLVNMRYITKISGYVMTLTTGKKIQMCIRDRGTVPELIHKANGKVWELSVSPQEARQWQTKTTVANLRHEGRCV